MPRTPSQPRAMRAVALGTVIWLLTLLGHAAGGGSLPNIAGLLVAGVLAAALGMAVASRRRGVGSLLLILLAGQLLLHLVLGVASHGHGSALTWSMVAGHVVAALIAALAVDRGEELVARWVAYLAQAIGPRDLAPVLAPAFASTAISTITHDAYDTHLIDEVRRRGPPHAFALIR